MLTKPDFTEKKIIIISPKDGDKLSFKNDNLIVTDSENKIKLQVSCYKIFAIYIIGGISITTGIIEKSKRYAFSIVLFTSTFRVYETISCKLEGNTLLREKQYINSNSNEIARKIIINKIENQRENLLKIYRNNEKVTLLSESINILEKNKDIDISRIMGIEGVVAKYYFKTVFNELEWNGRQPRVKRDKINLLLDIGYTILFNYIDAILNIYGFDTYRGNLHQDFYMRKSLVCDMVEPFRPIIDYCIRKGFNLGRFNKYEFEINNSQYFLKYKYSADFMKIVLEEINAFKGCIFDFIQNYYRWFMKRKSIEDFPKARLIINDIN